MLGLGITEILLILLFILLLFGARRIPEVMRGIGQGLREFRKGNSEATEQTKRAVDEADREVVKPKTKQQ